MNHAIATHWKLMLALGMAMVVLGFLALMAPAAATIAVDIYVGWLLMFSGMLGLVAMFFTRGAKTFLWSLVTALLSLVVGGMLVLRPAEGVVSLTILLTAFFLAEGIFQAAHSLSYRKTLGPTWGWLLMSGIADLILAALIVFEWPTSANWVLGLLVGVNLITSGWAIAMAAWVGRDIAKTFMVSARRPT